MISDKGLEMLEAVDINVMAPRDQVILALAAAQLMTKKEDRLKAIMIAAMTSALAGLTTEEDRELFATATRLAAQGHEVFAAWAHGKSEAARAALN